VRIRPPVAVRVTEGCVEIRIPCAWESPDFYRSLDGKQNDHREYEPGAIAECYSTARCVENGIGRVDRVDPPGRGEALGYWLG
jgi:hypothetical protein